MIPPKHMRGVEGVSESDSYNPSSEATIFSSSLPVLPHEKLNLNDTAHDLDKLQQDVEESDLLADVEAHAIGCLLPDDEDELLAGIIDFDLTGLPSCIDDLEDYDLFGSGGGMELENDLRGESLSVGLSNVSLFDGVVGNGVPQYGLANGNGNVVGEHPYGEHPSRTLFVRNINSNVEDSELKALFEQYGGIRTLYTACKHRGFVMVSYYDIRAARTAMRALQNKPLRRRKLDIHFSIPKDNPSDKDMNQGTLVVFNLDPAVSNEDLRRIFGAYGEVKEIRETPHKRHHKFIEFYDVRAAEAALKSLNRSDIAGKRIKLEPSRPGGSRRISISQPNQDLEQDETRSFLHHAGSPLTNSPPGNWAHFKSPIEPNLMHTINTSTGFRPMPIANNHLSGLASVLRPQQSHSLPDPKMGPYQKLSGPQFLWGSPNPLFERSDSTAGSTPSSAHLLMSNGKNNGLLYPNRLSSFMDTSHHHHVGSAPSGVYIERKSGYLPDSPETSYIGSAGFRGHNDGSFIMNMGTRAGFGVPGNVPENGSSSFRMMSSPRLSPMFMGNGPYLGLTPMGLEGLTTHGRSGRRVEGSVKHFQLDLDKIIGGEDTRTTLMIKNIPNKYTSKMLLASIDENHWGTYDFVYLPIDFKNKCNVGYAFINMLSPKHIISFYQAFNGKKWEKFNSEKVATLAYARIQGKTALVTHFQNSSLMNEDKRCRPIVIHTDGHYPRDGSFGENC